MPFRQFGGNIRLARITRPDHDSHAFSGLARSMGTITYAADVAGVATESGVRRSALPANVRKMQIVTF
jgi:hypothetical protein